MNALTHCPGHLRLEVQFNPFYVLIPIDPSPMFASQRLSTCVLAIRKPSHTCQRCSKRVQATLEHIRVESPSFAYRAAAR